MAAPAVVVNAGLISSVVAGGTPANAIPPNASGGVITNPLSNSDQGIANAEPLFVNPRGAAALAGHGDTFSLQPGQSWVVIPGQTTPTSVNAATNGHKFSVIWW